MSMKVTVISARVDKAGKHNDRNFNLSYAPHIDQDRVKDNKYYTYNGDYEHSFEEIEKAFYKEKFEEHLDAVNERNIASKHGGRVRDMDDYYHAKYSRPEDVILQIGNIKEHASGEDLWECALAYKDAFEERFGDHCKILDMALHMDEETPHVHVRRVWMSEDNDGHSYVNQTNALSDIGYSAADAQQREGRNNNPKIVFSGVERELFRSICMERGLDIDMSPGEKRQHLSTLEFKEQKAQEHLEELEREIKRAERIIKESKEIEPIVDEASAAIMEFLDSDPFSDGRYQTFLEEIDEKDRAEKFRLLNAQYKALLDHYLKDGGESIKSLDAFTRITMQTTIDRELVSYQSYISQRGLEDDYRQYKAEHSTAVVSTFPKQQDTSSIQEQQQTEIHTFF